MKTKTQELPDKFCSQCGSTEIIYDEDFGFYKCLSSQCDHCWGYDEDDPDYDELDDLDGDKNSN